MSEAHKNILIVNTFGIGDVLFSTPMAKALKKHFPGATIDFICNKRCQYILRHNKNIDDIIVFEKDEFRKRFDTSKINFIKKIFKFAKKLRNKKYDLAIDLSLGYQLSLLLKLLGVKKRIGFNYRNRGRFLTDKVDINGFSTKHAVEYYMDILRLVGINNVSDKTFELNLSPKLEGWGRDFIVKNKIENKILVGLAPGGGKSWGRYAIYRRWSPEDFSYVARKLSEKEKNIVFLIFGSTEEKELCKVIEDKLGSKAINLGGELLLTQTMALIKKCNLLLCNDGGLLHIAVSQDVNTVSIFGPVDDKVYGPYPPSWKHKVAKAESLECRPCYKNFKHKVCGNHNCLKQIDKMEVLRLSEKSLNLYEKV